MPDTGLGTSSSRAQQGGRAAEARFGHSWPETPLEGRLRSPLLASVCHSLLLKPGLWPSPVPPHVGWPCLAGTEMSVSCSGVWGQLGGPEPGAWQGPPLLRSPCTVHLYRLARCRHEGSVCASGARLSGAGGELGAEWGDGLARWLQSGFTLSCAVTLGGLSVSLPRWGREYNRRGEN